jgi:hypothetical protein
MAAKGSGRLPDPDDRSPCLLPIRFFPFQATTHACLKLWLILPEAGHKDLDLFPAMRGSTFFPRRFRVSSRKSKKDRPFLILHWRFGPAAAGQIAPGS